MRSSSIRRYTLSHLQVLHGHGTLSETALTQSWAMSVTVLSQALLGSGHLRVRAQRSAWVKAVCERAASSWTLFTTALTWVKLNTILSSAQSFTRIFDIWSLSCELKLYCLISMFTHSCTIHSLVGSHFIDTVAGCIFFAYSACSICYERGGGGLKFFYAWGILSCPLWGFFFTSLPAILLLFAFSHKLACIYFLHYFNTEVRVLASVHHTHFSFEKIVRWLSAV